MTTRRSLSCTSGEWRKLKARAAARGISVSTLVITSALHDEPRLILSALEQRRLLQDVRELRRACEAFLEPLPHIGVTPREALQLLVRARRSLLGHDNPSDAPRD